MRDFSVCTPKDGAQALICAVERLMLLRDDQGPLSLLRKYALALYEGDIMLTEHFYNSLTRSLISCGARRISGDIFKDFLIYMAVQRANPFSELAASGRTDGLTVELMQNDLVILGSLMPFCSRDAVRMAQERAREISRLPGRTDDLSRISTELWSGTQQPVRPERPRPLPAGLEPMDYDWPKWSYDTGAAQSFVADEALEQVYDRLLNGSWSSATDTLFDFFTAYGCGEFLRWRLMCADSSGLCALPDGAAAPLIGSLYDKQRTLLMDNAIRFMRGESCSNMLIRGPQGVGKSAAVYSLAYELPELRLIRLCPGADISALMERLSDQPLKFLVLLDDIEPDSSGIRLRLSELCSGFAQPANVLFCATCRSGESSFFPLVVDMPCLTLTQFCSAVTDILNTDMCPADPARIHTAAVDHQVECRDRLTFAGALRVAAAFRMVQ